MLLCDDRYGYPSVCAVVFNINGTYIHVCIAYTFHTQILIILYYVPTHWLSVKVLSFIACNLH